MVTKNSSNYYYYYGSTTTHKQNDYLDINSPSEPKRRHLCERNASINPTKWVDTQVEWINVRQNILRSIVFATRVSSGPMKYLASPLSGRDGFIPLARCLAEIMG